MPRAAISCAVLLVALAGCRSAEKVDFELPQGFRGPAVIVFEESVGVEPKRNAEGRLVFQISADGILRAKGERFYGRYDLDYYEVDSSGNRTPLTTRAEDPSTLQVFAEVSGTTDMTGIPDVRWWAFVVGVPADRDDWKDARNAHTKAAVWSRPGF